MLLSNKENNIRLNIHTVKYHLKQNSNDQSRTSVANHLCAPKPSTNCSSQAFAKAEHFPCFHASFSFFLSLLPRVEMNKMLVDLMVQTWRDHERAVTLDRNLHTAKAY